MNVHEYERDKHSGAGNCWCGRPERDRRHRHVAERSGKSTFPSNDLLCTCGLVLTHSVHVGYKAAITSARSGRPLVDVLDEDDMISMPSLVLLSCGHERYVNNHSERPWDQMASCFECPRSSDEIARGEVMISKVVEAFESQRWIFEW